MKLRDDLYAATPPDAEFGSQEDAPQVRSSSETFSFRFNSIVEVACQKVVQIA